MSVHTPIGVLCYPTLFTPRPVAQGAEPRYGCDLLFDQAAQKTPEFQALRKAVSQAIDAKWPGKSADKDFVSKLALPFRKTSEKPDKAGYKDIPGGVFIKPWSKNKPGVVDKFVQPVTVPSDVWAGQTARASVNAFAYDQGGNKGVSFGLNNLQICDTSGLRLDGRKPATEDFDSLGGDMPDDDEPPF
jgi:hypothetical protein